MKKLIVSALPLLLMLPFATNAQCNFNNTIYLTSAAPTIVASTISGPQTWAGEFNRITGMQAGYTYEVSTCGTPTFDSELTIFPSGGGNWLAFDDDGCGVIGGSSKILFTPAVTGDYDIQLNEFGCLTNSIDMTMDITLISTGTSTGGPSITIPVVVHVVYKNSTENVSITQIQSQLDVLNADFRKLNADFAQTPAAFQGAGADMSIEFCLASVDPNGNPTTGITRTSTTTPGFSQGLEPKFTANGGIENWDPERYLNLWVCDLGGSLLGYATFPVDLAAEPELDGVVIDYAYFGSVGATPPFDKGRTATHEVGHWMNLRHIWGDNFCGDDFVNDTPVQEQSNGGCPSFPHVTCSNGANGDMFMNYMDYVDDACMVMFTNGQKTRSDATFANLRTLMSGSGGCGTTGLHDEVVAMNVRIYPNPANDVLTIENNSNLNIDKVEIFDVTGRLVLSELPVITDSTIHIDSLRAGTYFVKITSGVASVQMKLIVQ